MRLLIQRVRRASVTIDGTLHSSIGAGLLLLVGIVYICETLSDIIQVAYFKATHGKRFFKMAPLHHHLELSGWSETKLVVVFSGITVVCCALAFAALLGRMTY